MAQDVIPASATNEKLLDECAKPQEAAKSAAAGKSLDRVFILLFVAAIAIAAYAYFEGQSTPGFTPPIKLGDAPMHIHPRLFVYIDGEKIQFPANVGRGAEGGLQLQGEYPVHTHGEDYLNGTVHVESADTRPFTLGHFFQIWGKKFNKDCIMDYCSGWGKKLSMRVNGLPNYEFDRHVLKDGE
ncbi:hypothetical protein FJZ26_00060, partial [Candidatus Parvarchaeota archaeon]|nr:hypothetical protein [Candidatus Parvarchaeota archaeon]